MMKWQQAIESRLGICYNLGRETKAGRLTLFYGGANPPDERKEGDADVCYIF